MKYVYFVDCQDWEETTKNQKVFLLIKDLNLPDDNIFADDSPQERVEFGQLLDTPQRGDTLIVRSALDLDLDINCVSFEILPYLAELGVELFSCEEPYLCGTDYADTMSNVLSMVKRFLQQKQNVGYQKAMEEKRVGRPSKSEEVEQAIKLYQSGNYKISQIEKLTGISKSTLYKYLKE